ncbi:hypothetical protein L6164_008542 [Bauhinia variegata]|uniref:Uncharacterized protein n=1 Tax=Bauhinia variegata TaxID=167791 RepID=A0ACB9PFY0_BAUVA|nr:hypothetical protein L6164_008542 [Bauhinia variegata]
MPKCLYNLHSSVDYVNYLTCHELPPEATYQQRKKFLSEVRFYFWDNPMLYRRCSDHMIRRCAPEEAFRAILESCYSSSYAGHYAAHKITNKVLQSSFYWPTLFKDA